MTAGEEKNFALVFPADYHGREVAGKKAQFALTLRSVSEPHLPPVDDGICAATSASRAAASTSCARKLQATSPWSSSARSKAFFGTRS